MYDSLNKFYVQYELKWLEALTKQTLLNFFMFVLLK